MIIIEAIFQERILFKNPEEEEHHETKKIYGDY